MEHPLLIFRNTEPNVEPKGALINPKILPKQEEGEPLVSSCWWRWADTESTTSESWVFVQAEDSKPDENVQSTLFRTFTLKRFCVEEITVGQLLDHCINHAHGE